MLHLIFIDNDLIVEIDENQKYKLPNNQHISLLKSELSIVQDDNTGFIAYITQEKFNRSALQFTTISVRSALNHFPLDVADKIVYYLQLINYYKAHQFCGHCGHPLSKPQSSIFMYCEACQLEVYPKLSPCIIVRITKGEQILLARGPEFPPGIWALIAGFVELGESLESAIHREIMEEVGIKVHNIRYWGSQSWLAPTSSLMIGFSAEYKSGEIQVDKKEIEQANFFSKDNIPGIPAISYSIASKMINEFLEK